MCRLCPQVGADVVEIRLDYVASTDYAAIVKHCRLPILWTLRHGSEGGKFTGSIEEQIERLASAIEAGGDYVDIEYQRWLMASDDERQTIEKKKFEAHFIVA